MGFQALWPAKLSCLHVAIVVAKIKGVSLSLKISFTAKNPRKPNLYRLLLHGATTKQKEREQDSVMKKNTTMRTLSSPTGPNELFTILAMAWQAMTALTTKDPNSSACQPEAHQEAPRESKKTREKKQHKLRVCDKNNTSAASAFGTILRANILPGLPISQDFQVLRHSFSLSFFTPFFLPGSPICSLSLLLLLLLLLLILEDDDSSHKTKPPQQRTSLGKPTREVQE